MSAILKYKAEIDKSDRDDVKAIMYDVRNNEEISYLDKQEILCYGSFKMDYFEDAIMYYKNAMLHLNDMKAHNKEAYKDYISKSVFDFLAGFIAGESSGNAGENICGTGACCSYCCICTPICFSCDCYWNHVAETSDNPITQTCLPPITNCSANCVSQIFYCAAMPFECCTNC